MFVNILSYRKRSFFQKHKGVLYLQKKVIYYYRHVKSLYFQGKVQTIIVLYINGGFEVSERRDKSNKKFMLLSAIGIFMVVDSHTFTAFNILGDFLPYNSFFMPMFVFISGYFNKVNNSTNL